MPDSTGLIAHNWGFAIFLLGVVGLCAFMLGLSSLLGSKAWGRSKNEPFESGMLPTGSARLRLSAKFYLVATTYGSPIERPYSPKVDKTCQQNCYENECFDESGPAAFADRHRPCKEKEGFDIEDHEQHRDQIEFG